MKREYDFSKQYEESFTERELSYGSLSISMPLKSAWNWKRLLLMKQSVQCRLAKSASNLADRLCEIGHSWDL
jgi:hypothetical protein